MGQNYHWDTSSGELFEGKAILAPEMVQSDQRCNRRGKAYEAQPIQLLIWKMIYWLKTSLIYLHLSKSDLAEILLTGQDPKIGR